MFGWEFPPHISGGLGTACHGLTQSLLKERVHVLFVIPKAYGDEDVSIRIVNASDVIVPLREPKQTIRTPKKHTVQKTSTEIITIPVESALTPYTEPEFNLYEERTQLKHWTYSFPEQQVSEPLAGKKYAFTGAYGPTLMDEVTRYAEVAGEIARQHEFDVIHAHDWLTYDAGINARNISGKPLVIHVHATEYDRAGESMDPRVYKIEQRGLKEADKIIAVSNWTKKILVERYRIPSQRISVVHNGVIPKKEVNGNGTLPPLDMPMVTFLGRITRQKGPQYFIEAAKLVNEKMKDVHFVMAGSGDMMPSMIELVARHRLSSRFHFTGFLKGNQVDRIWKMTDIYVMPSVSEPFGISPLEAAQAGVPVIISKQSGVAEVMKNAVKVDFWNTKTLANSILKILKSKELSELIKQKSEKEISKITWDQAARKVRNIYEQVIRRNQKSKPV